MAVAPMALDSDNSVASHDRIVMFDSGVVLWHFTYDGGKFRRGERCGLAD